MKLMFMISEKHKLTHKYNLRTIAKLFCGRRSTFSVKKFVVDGVKLLRKHVALTWL